MWKGSKNVVRLNIFKVPSASQRNRSPFFILVGNIAQNQANPCRSSTPVDKFRDPTAHRWQEVYVQCSSYWLQSSEEWAANGFQKDMQWLICDGGSWQVSVCKCGSLEDIASLVLYRLRSFPFNIRDIKSYQKYWYKWKW